MGCEADIIVIGPYNILKKYDALEYPDEFYDGVPEHALVFGSLMSVVTTSTSHALSDLCCVDLWDLGNHKVTKTNADALNDLKYCVDYDVMEAYDNLRGLLKEAEQDERILIWFIPNG